MRSSNPNSTNQNKLLKWTVLGILVTGGANALWQEIDRRATYNEFSEGLEETCCRIFFEPEPEKYDQECTDRF